MNIANVKVGHVMACVTDYKPITSGMVGVTVTFEYDDPVWNGLHKTAVFTAGRVTRDVLNADSVVTIPADALKKEWEVLHVGVYGTDDNGKLVIPTVMTQVGVILPGADPSGDPGTDPELPIWARLQEEVEQLKENGVTDEQIAAAVADYLEEHPVDGGGGGYSIIVDDEGYLTTTNGGFEIDSDGYIVM